MNNLDNQRMATMQSNNRIIDKSKNLSPAFTIIELLVVIGILGILMAVLIGTFSGSTESARAAKCQSNMRNLAMGVQSYGMGGYFPHAGSFDKYKGVGSDKQTVQEPGWISWSARGSGGKYLSPYDRNAEAREFSLTNGTLWASMHGSRDSYVCPSHVRHARDKKLGDPLWSYAMSAYFGWASKSTPRFNGHNGRGYRSFRRSDRYLLFAELPFAAAENGSHEAFQTAQTSASASKANDPVLQYQNCEGGGDEAIGFNHKDGKNTIGHVCFADGHVEKLRVPKSFSAADARELTEWLCRPVDNSGKDFDVSFDGKTYKKDQTTAQ